jgi:chloride channel, nucleotide-sensitive, 1A
MMLDFASPDGGDDADFSSPELTLIPKPSTESTGNPAQELYEAIANCSNLHFDEDDEEEEEDDRIIYEGSAEHQALEGFSGVLRGASDGSLPPPMPGSGGWITAENVHEYFDEDGNWIGPGAEDQEEELGEGAGRTRPHDEVDGGETNGDAQEDTKRPRVDDQAPSS